MHSNRLIYCIFRSGGETAGARAFPVRLKQRKDEMERHRVFWGFLVAAAISLFVGWESYRYTARVEETADARKQILPGKKDTVAVDLAASRSTYE